MSRILRQSRGFTLIEFLIAMFILLVGIVATIGVFSTSKRTTLVAQRHEIVVHVAQREMEKMRSLKYSELGLDLVNGATPQNSANPNHPNNRVRSGDGRFVVDPSASSSTCCEEMATTSTQATGGKVLHGGTTSNPGEPFTVGEGGSAVSGRIFRYVSWRKEECLPLVCDGDRDTKRLAVAVSLNAVGSPPIGPIKPVWETSIASDPNEGPTGSDPSSPPPPAPTTSAQNFYLYDTRCSSSDASNVWTQPATHTDQYNTASNGSSCEISDASRRPSLMGPVAPSYTAPSPVYRYSPETIGVFPAGLALVKPTGGSTCPAASYPAADGGPADNSTPSKWSTHTWATRKFSQAFVLSGRVFLSLWTTSVGSSTGTGRFCATLIDRKWESGAPNDVVLGSMSREYFPWPTTKVEPGRDCGTPDFPCGRQLSFSTTITATNVRADSRLVLVLSVLHTSDKSLVFLYDDPRYRSLLEVETTTPCGSSGPCPAS